MPAIRELDPTAGPLDFFGAEVRRWRNAAGLSQEQLGQRIGYSGALVGKVETGDRAPSLDFAEGCDRALPTADGLFGRLYELARHWDGGYPSWFTEWVEAERRAITLRTWQPLLVPGLLQTPDYARALFLAWHGSDSDDQVDQLVNARIERQAIFQPPDPPSLWAVLDEGVLRRRIGSGPTMRDQLLHLLAVSRAVHDHGAGGARRSRRARRPARGFFHCGLCERPGYRLPRHTRSGSDNGAAIRRREGQRDLRPGAG